MKQKHIRKANSKSTKARLQKYVLLHIVDTLPTFHADRSRLYFVAAANTVIHNEKNEKVGGERGEESLIQIKSVPSSSTHAKREREEKPKKLRILEKVRKVYTPPVMSSTFPTFHVERSPLKS